MPQTHSYLLSPTLIAGGLTTVLNLAGAGLAQAQDAAEAAPAEPASSSQLAEEPAESPASSDKTVAEPEEEPGTVPESEPKTESPYDGPATLLGGKDEKMHIGGFGGFSVQGTSINGTGGVLTGFDAALLLDHRFAVGFSGYGLVSEVSGPDLSDGAESILGFGYGGTSLRYHMMSERSPITLSLGTLIGAGGLTLLRESDVDDFDYEGEREASIFFVVEPSLQAHLHLTRWMRVGLNGGYRFVRGPSLQGVEDGDLQGVTAGGHLQFGWF